DFDVDLHRWEDAGNGTGGEHDLAEELLRFAGAARGDRAHVPDDEPVCIDVGGADIEAAASGVGGGHLGNHLGRQFAIDQPLDRPRIVKGVGERNHHDRPAAKDFTAGDAEHGGAEAFVVLRAEECIGGDEATRADTGDHVEAGAYAGLGPAAEDADAERAVHAAAGEGEEVVRWGIGGAPGGEPLAVFVRHFASGVRVGRGVGVRGGAQVDQVMLGADGVWHAVAAGAADQREHG